MIGLKFTPCENIGTVRFAALSEMARGYIADIQGDEFGGWVDLPINYDKDEFARIEAAAKVAKAGYPLGFIVAPILALWNIIVLIIGLCAIAGNKEFKIP